MASGGDMVAVKKTLGAFVERGTTGKSLGLSQFIKCVKACGLEEFSTTIDGSIWSKFKERKISIDKIVSEVIPATAAYTAKQKGEKRSEDVVKALFWSKLAARSEKPAVEAKSVDKTTARMTDTSKYTGSHKERFGEDGKGKGLEGRTTQVDGSGYVGNYKGANTFDDKH